MIRTYLSIDLSDLRAIQKDVWVIEAEKINFIDFACKAKKKKSCVQDFARARELATRGKRRPHAP